MKKSEETLLSQMTLEDWIILWTLAVRSRALSEILKKTRDHIYGACLLGILQELVSLIPSFVLYKKGIFLSSIKHGDHRTLWELFVMADFINSRLGSDAHCDLNHIDGIFRNHYNKIPFISPITGEADSNGGRDGNTHNRGCLSCRIIGLLVSDMGRLVGMAAGYGEAIVSEEWPSISDWRKRPVGISFHGEGAEQQGVIHETRNRIATNNYKYASLDEIIKRYGDHWIDDMTRENLVLRPSPHIMVINANTRSLFADAIEEHGNSELHLRAHGYGNMKGYSVHDWDIPRMFEVFEQATENAQQCIPSLVVVKSYRGTAHNEDQIKYEEGALERGEFGKAIRVSGLDDLSEFREAWAKDPVLRVLHDFIDDSRFASADMLDDICGREREAISERASRILAEPDITLEYDKQDRSWFPAVDWNTLPKEPETHAKIETKKMGYNDAFAWIISKLMEEDPRVRYFGEDVYNGGVLGLTKGIGETFGPKRIWNMPISEEDGVLNAAGLGLYGLKAFLEFQFSWFGHDADAAIACVATQWYQKKLKMNFIMVYPGGIVRSGGSAQYHEEWPEKNLWEKKGVVIVCPADAYELVGIVRALHAFEGPSAILLQISAGNMPEFARDIPLDPYVIPFGKARTIREGTDVTVIAYGPASLHAAKNEAEFSAKDGISVEVINPLTLRPFDADALVASASKTGRVIIMQEASEETGIGSEMMRAICESDAFFKLRAKPALICAGMEGDLFIGTAKDLVWARLPYYKDVIELQDEKKRPIKRDIHRSKILHERIKNLMRYT